MCRSPSAPVPYSVWGKGDDKHNYSPDVRSNGLVIKRADSRFTATYGDEPGVGKGVKSNTVGDVVAPVSSSRIVRANGVPVQRHGDTCTLNRGNCPGEYVHVKSTDTHKAPDGHDQMSRPWYERFWDQARDKSDTIQAGEGIVGKAREYASDPSAIGRDARSAYEGLPTAGEALDRARTTAGNIASGAGNVAERVWTDPVGSAQAAGGYVRDQAVGAVEGTKRVYREGGLAAVAGAGAGTALDAFNPGKKLKAAQRVGEGLEGLGDAAKAEQRIKQAKEAEDKAKRAAEADAKDGARSTRRKGRVPKVTRDRYGRIIRWDDEIRPEDIGTGTPTNQAARDHARSLGRENDDAGHARGSKLGGSGTDLDNIFPQASSVNRGQFRVFEGNIADQVRSSGQPATISLRPTYEGTSTRPTSLTYDVRLGNGRTISKVFNNP